MNRVHNCYDDSDWKDKEIKQILKEIDKLSTIKNKAIQSKSLYDILIDDFEERKINIIDTCENYISIAKDYNDENCEFIASLEVILDMVKRNSFDE